MALYETVMVRAYETQVDPGTTVDVNTGMLAAGRLQAMIESRAGETSLAEIVVNMNRVIEAVRTTVPESMWPEIRRQLEGDEQPAAPGSNPAQALRATRPDRERLWGRAAHNSESRDHRLGLEVVVEHLRTHLAAPARLLVAAERHRGVEHVVRVDPHRAGAEPGGSACAPSRCRV